MPDDRLLRRDDAIDDAVFVPVPPQRFEVVKDYFPDGLLGLLGEAVSALGTGTVRVDATFPPNRSAAALVDARRRVLALLRSAEFGEVSDLLAGTDGAPGIAQSMLRREFGAALRRLARIAEISRGPEGVLDQSVVVRALTRDAVSFHLVDSSDPAEHDVVGVEQQVPGYAGPALSIPQQLRLVELSQILCGGRERDVVLPALTGACLAGAGRFGDAIRSFGQVLLADSAEPPAKNFAAIEAAVAHVDLGDRHFRSVRSLDEQGAADVRRQYRRAIRLLDDVGVPESAAARREITARIEQQRTRISAGLNPLGLRDSHAPPQRFGFLGDLARSDAEEARTAAGRFADFLAMADARDDLQAELQAELETAERTVTAADERVAVARDQVARVDAQASMIAAQQQGQLLSNVAALGMAVTVAAAATTGGGALLVAGVSSTLVAARARGEELGLHAQANTIDRRLAERQETIAGIEADIARLRRDFVRSRIEQTGGRRLSGDLFHALARTFEDLARAHLENAIRVGYLYERAVAYELGRFAMEHIRFDYADGDTGVLGAADVLIADIGEVLNEFTVGVAGRDRFVEKVSLLTEFPVDFARFRSSGVLDFALSLRDLDRRRPGSSMGKIVDVQVELRGSIPSSGFTGRITHGGRFLLRDRAATLDPTTVRFLPTDATVAAALQDTARGPGVLVVGGVVLVDRGPDTKELDAEAGPDGSGLTFLLDRLEGYGPAGPWRLEVDPAALDGVTDVMLTLHIEADATDTQLLGPRVQELLRSFDAESGNRPDRVLVVSLRRRFPDALADLATGTASFTLDADDIEGTNPAVTRVVGQVIGPDGAGADGVRLIVEKPDAGFAMTRDTRGGGFTENPSGPLPTADPSGFPPTGSWTVRVPAGTAVADVQLFVIYEFDPD